MSEEQHCSCKETVPMCERCLKNLADIIVNIRFLADDQTTTLSLCASCFLIMYKGGPNNIAMI